MHGISTVLQNETALFYDDSRRIEGSFAGLRIVSNLVS